MSPPTEARLVVAERIVRRDCLHGTWWPRTTDIQAELALLLAHPRTRTHQVFRVSLNRDDWPGAPMIVQSTQTRSPKISWYAQHEPHLAQLHIRGPARIALLLLPPDTPEDVALTVMLMTTTSGNCLGTTQTLARAYGRVSQGATS